MKLDSKQKNIKEFKYFINNRINILIKSSKYYNFHKKNIDFLCKQFCIKNTENLYGLYSKNKTDNGLIFLGESAYSRHKKKQEEFRITFAHISNKNYAKDMEKLKKLNYKLRETYLNIIENYCKNNPNTHYNLGLAFQEKSFSGIKLYFYCTLQSIKQYFPNFYSNLIGKKVLTNQQNSICLLGLNFSIDGNLNDYKLYGSFPFMKKELLNSIDSKYHSIINDNNNNFIFKYFIRVNNYGKKSYKINSINLENKDLLNLFDKYYPEKNNLENVKIIGIGFDNTNKSINKIDKYLLFLKNIYEK